MTFGKAKNSPFMIQIIKQEIEMEENLKHRLEYIFIFVKLSLYLLMGVLEKLINLI